MSPTVQPPETDLMFPLPAEGDDWDGHTIHTHYFGFTVPEAAIGAFLYLRCQPVYRLSSGGVCMFQGMHNPRPLDCAHVDFQNTMPWPSVADGVITMANGLRIEFTEPGREVRLSYRSADGRCAFEVTQTAVTPLLARGHVMPGEDEHSDPAASPGGSEQFMRSEGELTLDGVRYPVSGYAIRDRSWRQVRTEREVVYPPVGWSPMCFGEDLVLNQVSVEHPDTKPVWSGAIPFPADRPTHHFAWAVLDGRPIGVREVRREVLERHPQLHAATRQNLEIVDETGRRHRLTGRALAMAQLPSWPNNLFFDSVYEWTDERGRLAHCTYQEAWYASFQRLMRRQQ